MSSDKGRWLNRENACTFHRDQQHEGLSKEKKKERERDAASIQSTNWEEVFSYRRCLHRVEVITEIAWFSVKIKQPLFPGTRNYSVIARDREREGGRERRDMNVPADLEKAIALFKRCWFIVLRCQNHAVMAEKENKHWLHLFPCENCASATCCQLTNYGFRHDLVL